MSAQRTQSRLQLVAIATSGAIAAAGIIGWFARERVYGQYWMHLSIWTLAYFVTLLLFTIDWAALAGFALCALAYEWLMRWGNPFEWRASLAYRLLLYGSALPAYFSYRTLSSLLSGLCPTDEESPRGFEVLPTQPADQTDDAP